MCGCRRINGSWPETLHHGAVLDLVFPKIQCSYTANNSSVPSVAGTLVLAWVNIFMLAIAFYLKFIQDIFSRKKFLEVNSIINLQHLR